MEDSRIIELFFERSECAITELNKKYGRLCKSVSMNILSDERDVDECVNDAYWGVWKAIPPQRPDSLKAFVCSIVRRMSIDKYKHNQAYKRRGNYESCIEELDNLVVSKNNPESELEKEELTKYIDSFLKTISKTDRMIFVRRFWYMDSYENIARISGMKEGAVRTRASRIREKLRIYLKGVM